MKTQNMNYLLKGILILVMSACSTVSLAQKGKADSVILLLEQSKTSTGIDSVAFQRALLYINNTTLSDSVIKEIEREAAKFNKGANEDLSYVIKFFIFDQLISTDQGKAISYGKLNFEKLKTSKTPLAIYFRDNFLIDLRVAYRNANMITDAFTYFREQLNVFQKQNDISGMAACHYVLGGFYRITGLNDQAIYQTKKAISYMRPTEKNERPLFTMSSATGSFLWLVCFTIIGSTYIQEGNYPEAVKYCSITFNEIKKKPTNLYTSLDTVCLQYSALNLAYAKLLSNQLDSVDYYFKSTAFVAQTTDYEYVTAFLQMRAFYEIKSNQFDSADVLLNNCKQVIRERNVFPFNSAGTLSPDYYVALIRIQQKRYAEAVESLVSDIAWAKSQRLVVLRDEKLLASVYEKMGNNEKAKETYKDFIFLQDSLTADQNKYRTASFEVEQQMNADEISINKLQGDNKISSLTRNFTIGLAGLLLLLAIVIYYRFRSKQKAHQLLQNTLQNLKSTQSQLIQSEKMASLGELTAGIAHEIQNPLNFVNNFSEINTELIEELEAEIGKGNLDEVKVIIKDIKGNEQKINHHGKRADVIVKGMLQHSRSSSAVKEPVDINKLADEYFRLAYHGLRAKDKSFNATLKTEYDERIRTVNMIPQDIGRVILNLITNAFYVVNEKASTISPGQNYEPTVSVSTKKINDKVEIRIKDNGNGISAKVLDKIFQPFFTTKPAGQGTGLGLSLSYDIVKAHGGELSVTTKEGEGSEFIIQLPTN